MGRSVLAENALLEHAAATIGFDLAPEAIHRLGRFLDILEVWNRRVRLTGERSRARLLRRHVVDCLACVPILPPAESLVDIGSGAGFPGLVLACVRPDLPIVLVDARERCGSFLREAVRSLALTNVRVVLERAEDASQEDLLTSSQSLVVSRGIRVEVFLDLARTMLLPGGRAAAMQTPKTTRAIAERIAGEHGFRVAELRDYRLPDDEPRRLIVFDPD